MNSHPISLVMTWHSICMYVRTSVRVSRLANMSMTADQARNKRQPCTYLAIVVVPILDGVGLAVDQLAGVPRYHILNTVIVDVQKILFFLERVFFLD